MTAEAGGREKFCLKRSAENQMTEG